MSNKNKILLVMYKNIVKFIMFFFYFIKNIFIGSFIMFLFFLILYNVIILQIKSQFFTLKYYNVLQGWYPEIYSFFYETSYFMLIYDENYITNNIILIKKIFFDEKYIQVFSKFQTIFFRKFLNDLITHNNISEIKYFLFKN